MLVELSLVEQRYAAVLEVLNEGISVAEVAARAGVTRQTVHRWLCCYAADGLAGLVDKSSTPVSCPHQMDPLLRANQGRISPTRDPRCAAITNTMNGPRLRSDIEYADGSYETMEFELFTPDEIQDRASLIGLDLIDACCWWDSDRPPSIDEQRFQATFERT